LHTINVLPQCRHLRRRRSSPANEANRFCRQRSRKFGKSRPQVNLRSCSGGTGRHITGTDALRLSEVIEKRLLSGMGDAPLGIWLGSNPVVPVQAPQLPPLRVGADIWTLSRLDFVYRRLHASINEQRRRGHRPWAKLQTQMAGKRPTGKVCGAILGSRT